MGVGGGGTRPPQSEGREGGAAEHCRRWGANKRKRPVGGEWGETRMRRRERHNPSDAEGAITATTTSQNAVVPRKGAGDRIRSLQWE